MARDAWTRRAADAAFGTGIRAASLVTVLLLLAPTAVVVVASFTGSGTLQFPPPSWSLRWYEALFTSSDQLLAAARTSFVVAALSTLVCTVLGTLAACAIARSRSRWAVALDAVFMSPMVLPAMAFGLALLLVLSLAGVTLGTWTLVVGHSIVCTPFVIRMVSASAQQVDPALLDASEALGASEAFTFARVTLPLVARGVAAGAFVSFLSSFDHVPVSLMLADPRSETLPIHLWTILESNLDVRVASVCGIVVAATILIAFSFERLLRAPARTRGG
jgi:putative spermidine/putrescine transport system permease protein